MPNLESGKISGGIQYCVQMHVDILSEYHDVTIFTPKESFPFKNCTTLYSSLESFKDDDEERQKKIEIRNKEIEVALINDAYDLVIVHSYIVSTHVICANSNAKSVILFHHVTPPNLGGIAAFYKINVVFDSHKKGAIYALPSKSCVDQWIPYVQKLQKNYPENFTKNPNGDILECIKYYSYPFSSTEDFPVLDESDGTLVAVTRLRKDKKVKAAINFAKKYKLKLKLVCPKIITEEEQELAALYRKHFDLDIIEDVSRERVLQEIAKSNRLLVSNYEESFSIVAAEAAMCGIPIVTLAPPKGYYPAPMEACGLPETQLVDKDTTVIDMTPIPYKRKLEIANQTKERYSKKAIHDQLIKLANVSREMRLNLVSDLSDFF